MDDKIISGQESLKIIEQMINTAKNEHHEKGEGWLLWGWLLFISSITSFILVQIQKSEYVGWIWTGMTVIVIGVFIYESTTKKRKVVKTYVEELLEKFSTGFLFSLLTIITATTIIANFNNKDHTGNADNIAFAFGYFFILYAFWMYIHGSAIRFRPLIIGAAVNWISAIVIFIIRDFKYVMLISAVAVFIGYLIPGYLLRNQYNKAFNSKSNSSV